METSHPFPAQVGCCDDKEGLADYARLAKWVRELVPHCENCQLDVKLVGFHAPARMIFHALTVVLRVLANPVVVLCCGSNSIRHLTNVRRSICGWIDASDSEGRRKL